MAYRGSRTSRAPQRVRYGRFGPPASTVAVVFILFSVGGLFALLGTSFDTIRCARDEAGPVCVHDRGLLGITTASERFDGAALATLEYYELEHTRTTMARVERPDGRHDAVFDGSAADERAVVAGMEAFLRDPRAPSYTHEAGSNLMSFAPLLLVPGLFVLLFVAVRWPTSIVFEVDAAERTLVVESRHLWLIRRRRTFGLEGVVDVQARATTVRVHYQRGSRDLPAGRVLLRYEDGTQIPLTKRPLLGVAVHERAAESLRAFIASPP